MIWYDLWGSSTSRHYRNWVDHLIERTWLRDEFQENGPLKSSSCWTRCLTVDTVHGVPKWLVLHLLHHPGWLRCVQIFCGRRRQRVFLFSVGCLSRIVSLHLECPHIWRFGFLFPTFVPSFLGEMTSGYRMRKINRKFGRKHLQIGVN